ncbi:hypothetical protein L2E82_39151 [Cichorium intybus]|uniref:Uncharacterized protein n=1 Tax=Cichorium intybus TaxID=13427 RepID=A0ACB9AID6_CICIN|nr:hypothetical protein L2E82_39151 [Cichorium intybus]
MTEVVASLQALLELQKKTDDSAESSSTTGLTWKIHKYLVFTTKHNSDQNGTSSPKSLENNMIDGERPNQHGKLEAKLKKFTHGELRRATRDFGNDTFLGDGTYAEVYKGWVNEKTYSPSKHNTGLLIAVKRLHNYKQSTISKLDLEILKEFSHPNLVKLIGYCLEQNDLFLVYEFMHNGNFQDHLDTGAIARLPLVTKVKIAVGIAQGIIFLHMTQNQVGADPSRLGTVSESRLDRHNILLDEDFTAKLSGYDITKLVHGGYPRNTLSDDNNEIGDYYPGFHPSQLQSNLSGFTVVFTEVLTGKQISNENEFQKTDDLLHGKISLIDIAYKCFQICYGVHSESKMLKILEQYIPACQNEDFATETFERKMRRAASSSEICLDQWM